MESVALWEIKIVWLVTGVLTPYQPATLKTVLSEAGGG